MPKESRIAVRLDATTAREIRAYAERRGTTLTAIIEKHLRDLLREERDSPVLTHDAEQI